MHKLSLSPRVCWVQPNSLRLKVTVTKHLLLTLLALWRAFKHCSLPTSSEMYCLAWADRLSMPNDDASAALAALGAAVPSTALWCREDTDTSKRLLGASAYCPNDGSRCHLLSSCCWDGGCCWYGCCCPFCGTTAPSVGSTLPRHTKLSARIRPVTHASRLNAPRLTGSDGPLLKYAGSPTSVVAVVGGWVALPLHFPHVLPPDPCTPAIPAALPPAACRSANAAAAALATARLPI